MDSDIGRNGQRDRRPFAAVYLSTVVVLIPSAAAALELPDIMISGLRIDLPHILLLSITAGFAFAAAFAFRILIRTRGSEKITAASAQIAALQLELARASALIATDDQRCIVWDSADAPPHVVGALPERLGVPAERKAFLAIGRWVHGDNVRKLEDAVVRLRRHGEAFQMTVRTAAGELLDVNGRTAGKRVVARFREIAGERRSFAELKEQADYVAGEMTALRALAETLPYPVWRRSAAGRLTWVNTAYANAVGAPDPQGALSAGAELFSLQARDAVRDAHRSGSAFMNDVTAIVGGTRGRYFVYDVPLTDGSIGMGIDRFEVQALKAELVRSTQSYVRTLDQLTAAVVAFDGAGTVLFCNAAYRGLWPLPPHLLEKGASEAAILDHLRAERSLPEQADYREWRAKHLAAYEAPKSRQEWWYLPDNRSLRMVATPNAEGGLTYIFENVTEQLSLESRVNALASIQGETLDHLKEGVAVFGSDGRLRLFNPVFAEIWRLSPDMLRTDPHVSDVIEHCSAIYSDTAVWRGIRDAVTDLERSAPLDGRMERPDRSVIDYATVSLPEGMTMIAFVDVTDSVRVQRVLRERNEALEAADRLKSEFIQHVSYELRSPLTSIIGFAEMLSDNSTGPLNAKQRDYMDHIGSSSSALLTIINDILDLATVDAGIMVLDIDDVDVETVARSAVDGLKDRLEEQRIDLRIDFAPGIGTFRADESRIRQILFNLVSNAIRFSDSGGRVEITGERTGDWVTVTVADNGVGIPDDVMPTVFKPFESHSGAGHRRGAGLGLSIVKSLAELHGGNVDIRSEPGRGTTVTVRLPRVPAAASQAAA